MRFGLVDYGSGNLRSVAKAIDAVGGRVRTYASPAGLEQEDVLVLPGVGAYGDCVAQLHARELWEPIATWLREGRPYLGICLGYQLLFDSSEESPGAAGFGRFGGVVRRLRSDSVKVPHIGWNTITPRHPGAPLWQGLPASPISISCTLSCRSLRTRRLSQRSATTAARLPQRCSLRVCCSRRNFIRRRASRRVFCCFAISWRQSAPGLRTDGHSRPHSMLLLPAIDLMSGDVVRLRQGRAAEKTVFPGSPGEWAARWERAGGDWLHVVDLDAAFHEAPANDEAIRAIVAAVLRAIATWSSPDRRTMCRVSSIR